MLKEPLVKVKVSELSKFESDPENVPAILLSVLDVRLVLKLPESLLYSESPLKYLK